MTRPRGRPRVEVDVPVARWLRALGMSWRETARALGCSVRSLRRACADGGPWLVAEGGRVLLVHDARRVAKIAGAP